MTWDAYWERLCVGNSGLRRGDAKLTLTVDELRKVAEKSYRAGSSGRGGREKAARDFAGVKTAPENPLSDLFGSIFSGSGKAK